MQINKYQAKTLEILFENLPIDGDLDTLELSLSGDFSGKYICAYSRIADTDAYIVFNIPTYSDAVFMAVTEKSPKDVALVLANLEDYERESAVDLRLGEVVVIPAGSVENPAVPYAVLLLRTAISLDCDAVPDCLTIAGRHTRFFLAMPITERDHQLRHAQGHDALLDLFEVEQRGIFF